ncbi:MAG: hypothetical protein ACR2IS_02470 [Nitrososphaeraceae archaeon]
MFQVDMGQRRYAGYHNKYQMTRISTSDVFVHPHGFPYSYLRNDSLCTRKNSKFFESDAFIKQIFIKLSESLRYSAESGRRMKRFGTHELTFPGPTNSSHVSIYLDEDNDIIVVKGSQRL